MGNDKSKTIDKSTTAQGFAQSRDTAPLQPPQQMDIRMVRNVLLIWLDDNIDEGSADYRNTITQLRRIVHDVNKYMDADRCIEFLFSIENEKACMIISGSLSEYMVPLVHEIFQSDSVFILCNSRNFYEQRVKEWPNIKGVFTDIGPICEALKVAARRCEQDAMPISIIATTTDLSKKDLDQLDPSFMYTQILKEILFSIKFEQKHIDEFIQYCREALAGNEGELKQLKDQYSEHTPIWWYSTKYFLYSVLNRVLRVMNVDLIVRMGFFIGDLYCHITQLHQGQFTDCHSDQSFTVYHGQNLSKDDFEKLSRTKGGLFSFNNFLSTSKQREVALQFVHRGSSNPETVGVLFVMIIDPSQSNTPFASITAESQFQDREDEVLFSMHTVSRIGEITLMDGNNCLFEVELILTNDDDEDLRLLIDHNREETSPDAEVWRRLGIVLSKMGNYDNSQQVYKVLLEQAMDELEKARIHNQHRQIYVDKGKYEEALTFYETSLIGIVYRIMGEYPQTLSSHERALAIQQQSLPPNHPNLPVSYNNIGLVYENMKNYSEARSFYERAVDIAQRSSPYGHPDLQTMRNNLERVKQKL